MMASGATNAIVFVIDALARLYLLVLLLRLFLPLVRADFHNPLAQAVLKLTSPLVIPVRRILPPLGRIDTATVVVAFGIQYLAIFLMALVQGMRPAIAGLLLASLVSLVLLTINLFFWLVIIRIILSWVAGTTYNPAIAIVYALTEPLLRPFRRLVPDLGGFDISPIFVLIALGALMRLVMGFA
jgi:YggT family protein